MRGHRNGDPEHRLGALPYLCSGSPFLVTPDITSFFSRQLGKYQCLKCLVAREDLQYIDKKYKKQLEDFESIKEYGAKAIRENAPNIHIIAEWKG